MSKFYELKAAAEQTQRPHWSAEVNRAAMKEFEALATPVAILELLAIQAQLVAALKGLYGAIDSCIDLTPEVLRAASSALAAAGVQP